MTELPKGWAETSIGDLGKWGSGGTPKSDNEYFYGGEIPWIRSGDLPDGPIIDHEVNITPEGLANSSAKWVPEDAVLIAMYGATIGKLGITTYPVTTNQAVAFCQPNEAISSKFLFLGLSNIKQDLIEMGQGGAQPNISQQILKPVPFPLPPIPEQKRIVAKVDGLTARTARARTDLDRIPTLIARYKQRILALAFTGELTAGWRSNTEGEQIRGADMLGVIAQQKERIRQERSLRNNGRNRSLSVQSPDLPDLPSSWAWATFNDCSWDLTVGHVGPMKDRYVDEGIPFLRSLNIRENFIDLQKVVYIDEKFHGELRKSEIRAGELVVVRTGAPGTAAVVPETLGRANCSDLVIARLVPAMNPHYAAYYMNSQFAKSAVRGMQVGVAQQHFNVGAMSQMPVPVAPEQEQTEIVRRIESAFNWLDRVAADHAAASKLLPKLDGAILAQAFRGELVPQDPNDEPASVLLERIQAERAAAPKQAKSRKSRTLTPQEIAILPHSDNEFFEVIPKTPGASAMTKSRQDDDVMGQPYLAGLLKKGSVGTAQDLFKASDLPVADFYKQLAWEIEHKHIRDNDEKLEAL
ncbi:restriction endonuclease subunit S [Cognatishimia sp. 1_MG-2023]|uniref:restriction endonuclease subunit S n=1 Tax=Cognatishimia sp. 1_MG-2023 TaxID=3062642 RepID=UPI0026E380CA|nr:restriction endonuclease subunit S [Cognatishimia sp. 1_MG-2023]MDO6726247.1 restriction endonuclease subunit S [Cognatishimia sp. 1_MG-2023]